MASVSSALLAVSLRFAVDGDPAPSAIFGWVEGAVGRIGSVLEPLGCQWMAVEGECLLAALPDPVAAGTVALDLLGRHDLSLTLGLGFGAWQAAESLHGAEVSRVRRIAWRADAETVHATEAWLRGVALPQGVGVHRAAQHVVERVGFPVHQLLDYRG